MNALGGFAEGWARLAWAVTWQMAALGILAWLAQRALRLRQARVRHALWWFVLLAPLVMGPLRMALVSRQAAVEVAAPAPVARALAVIQTVHSRQGPEVEPGPLALSTVGAGHTEMSFGQWLQAGGLLETLAAAWLLGCAAVGIRLLVGHRQVRRMLAESREVDDPVCLDALAQLCSGAGIGRRIALRLSGSVGGPVLYGFRRPVIVVPDQWPASLTEEDLRAVLAHEVAHIRRHDFLANLAQRIIEVFLFYHPAAWLASRRITLAREELCDASALSMGTDAATYAWSLTVAAERAHGMQAPVSLGIAESRSTLLRRVEQIMTTTGAKRVSRPLMASVIAVGLVSVAAFAAIHIQEKPRRTKQTIMPSIPQGIHLTYKVTSQEFAWPPKLIEERIAGLRAEQAVHPENVAAEQLIPRFRARAVDGPIKTDTAEYWGTMHSLMAAGFNGGDCVAYDGRKLAIGAASVMVPDLIKQPTAERSGIVIRKGATNIDTYVPYLGIYQPRMTLFDDRVVLSETTAVPTGEKRVYRYRLPYINLAHVLQYDKEGRVTSMTIYAYSAAGVSHVIEEYRFADYAMVDGIPYPREVVRKRMTWYRPRGGKLAQLLDRQVTLRAVSASAEPIPDSFFALSTSRPGAQIQDDRYQITYRYFDPALSIDEASKRAYKSPGTQHNRQ